MTNQTYVFYCTCRHASDLHTSTYIADTYADITLLESCGTSIIMILNLNLDITTVGPDHDGGCTNSPFSAIINYCSSNSSQGCSLTWKGVEPVSYIMSILYSCITMPVAIAIMYVIL